MTMKVQKLKILDKLFDVTGTADGVYKGFVLFYVGEDGNPQIETRSDHNATALLLRAWVEDHAKLLKGSNDIE